MVPLLWSTEDDTASLRHWIALNNDATCKMLVQKWLKAVWSLLLYKVANS